MAANDKEPTHLEQRAYAELEWSPTNVAVAITGQDLSDPDTSALGFVLVQEAAARRIAMLGELCDTRRGMHWGAFMERLMESSFEVIASDTSQTDTGCVRHYVHAANPSQKLLVNANSWGSSGTDYLNSVEFGGYIDPGHNKSEQHRQWGELRKLHASISPEGGVEGTVFEFSVSALDGLFLRLDQLKRANLDLIDWGPWIDTRHSPEPESEAGLQKTRMIAQYPDWARQIFDRA